MRVVKLTEAEKEKLEYLYKTSDKAIVRRRSLSLRQSNDNHFMKSAYSIAKVERTTLYHLHNAWESTHGADNYTILSIAQGHRAKIKLAAVKE
ncbi:MAG: hypothetical protein LBL90_08435 [Prevotellaceae bacterium]|jgi:hypothetical protein|nr:hypothetical protein [Prevotellaceae bacterium]